MPASIGRLMQVKKNGTLLAGVKEKSLSGNSEGIDITSDDDSGFRTFLNAAGVRSIDIPVSGVSKDDILTAAILDPSVTDFILTDITLEYPGAVSTDTISGDFYFGNLEIAGSTNDAINFTATFQSSGAWTRTVGT